MRKSGINSKIIYFEIILIHNKKLPQNRTKHLLKSSLLTYLYIDNDSLLKFWAHAYAFVWLFKFYSITSYFLTDFRFDVYQKKTERNIEISQFIQALSYWCSHETIALAFSLNLFNRKKNNLNSAPFIETSQVTTNQNNLKSKRVTASKFSSTLHIYFSIINS